MSKSKNAFSKWCGFFSRKTHISNITVSASRATESDSEDSVCQFNDVFVTEVNKKEDELRPVEPLCSRLYSKAQDVVEETKAQDDDQVTVASEGLVNLDEIEIKSSEPRCTIC